jgi:ribosomal protein S18 acetylase RimI-like enzyme
VTDPSFNAGEDSVHFRRATAADLPTLARIHKQAYSHSHFTALLPDDVLRRYYGYFLDGGAETIVAMGFAGGPESKVVEEVVGFAVYGEGIPERIAAFKSDCFREIFLASQRHPWVAARKAIKAIFARMSARAGCPPADFLLLSIAVAIPGRGVGRRLLRAMLDEARRRGAAKAGLYVNTDNVGAINVYFAEGFVVKDFQNGQFYMEQSLGGR